MDAHIQNFLSEERFRSLPDVPLSPQKSSRDETEHLFNAFKQDCPVRPFVELVDVLKNGLDPELRSSAAVLLHNNTTLLLQLDNASRAKVTYQLLSCLITENFRPVWKVLCDMVGELAAIVFRKDEWHELLSFLLLCGHTGDFILREKALLVLGQFMPHATPVMHRYLDLLYALFLETLSSYMPHEVHLAALRAVARFIKFLDSSKQRYLFQDSLKPVMQTLIYAFEAHNEVSVQEELEVLIEVAKTAPRFLYPQLQEVLSLMLKIVEAQGLEDGTRHLALEFLLLLAEAGQFPQEMMRKHHNSVRRLFVFLLNLLLDVEDNASWYAADVENEYACFSINYEEGRDGLDRLSRSFGHELVFPVASELLPSYRNDLDWRKRQAALIALSDIARGCHEAMRTSLESIVEVITVSFGDPHIRVQWAAIHAIGTLLFSFHELANDFHQKIAPMLIYALGDFQNPHTQASAASSIVNFCRGSTDEVLKLWLDGFVEKLFLLLQNGTLMLQESALMTLGRVAGSAESLFRVYYDAIIPYLKHILGNARDTKYQKLRYKSLKCIIRIGLAAGEDKFRGDVKKVTDILNGVQSALDKNDDPITGLMLQTWACFCKTYGQYFVH